MRRRKRADREQPDSTPPPAREHAGDAAPPARPAALALVPRADEDAPERPDAAPAPAPAESTMSHETSRAPDAPGSEPEPTTFGRYLIRAREQRRLSLDDVAHLTKIRRAILEALETDARRDLPEKVFVLGYVRSYAAAVGLDVEATVRRFQATWLDEGPSDATESGEGRTRSWGWLPPTAAAALGAAIVWFIVQTL